MSHYRFQFFVVLILDVVSALTARYAFESGRFLMLLISIFSLALAGYFFIKLMQQRVGIVVNITWIALGTINVTVASWIVFAERINWMQGLAMAVIVTGLMIMEYFAPDEAVEFSDSAELVSLQPEVKVKIKPSRSKAKNKISLSDS